MHFIVPLKEKTVTEGESVTLECEISKAGEKVTWFKDGQPITPDEHFNITVEGEYKESLLY